MVSLGRAGEIAVALTLCYTLAGCAQSPPQARRAPAGGQQQKELMAAAWEGDVRRMEALINAGADVNARDQDLGTPLVAASYSGDPEAVRLLLERGAEVDAKDGEGLTPLMNASLNGRAEVVRLLLAKGADVNAVSPRTVDGTQVEVTALKLARGKRQAEVIEILQRAGAKE